MRRGSRSFRRSYSSSRRNFSGTSRHHHYRNSYYQRRSFEQDLIGFGIVIIIIIGILYVWGTWSIMNTLGSVETHEMTLGPHQTMELTANTIFDREYSVSTYEGRVSAYYFDESPPLSGKISRNVNGTFFQNQDTDNYLLFYLNKGSSMSILTTLSSSFQTAYTNLRIYEGKQADRYLDGKSANPMLRADDHLSFDVDQSSTYLIDFYSFPGFSSTMRYSINVEATIHDLSNPKKVITTNIDDLSFSENGADHLILYNPSSSEDVNGQIHILPRLPTFIYWLVFQITVIYVIIKIRGKSKNTKKNDRAGIDNTGNSGGLHADSHQGYVQKPIPHYCGECGSNILPSSKVCRSCGASI